ncbi:MAG: FAD/NAD(P)-binding protein [Candidatus Odinarchaeota archaeon]|nr:FAD/NAD(P)-binding protein [Candidatus Odinarchaeota archaeon]
MEGKNPYLPRLVFLDEFRDEAPNVRTVRVRFKEKGDFRFKPGQFVEVTVFGYGEAPFSISSSPIEDEYFEVTVRKMGSVTSALFRMDRGDVIGVRGPFGRGFPVEEAKGENVLLIGGGIGLAPLKPVIEYIIANRNDYGDVILLYGAKTPSDIVFKEEIEKWKNYIDVHLTVDHKDETWTGRVGVVTVLFDEIEVDPRTTYSMQCGPPMMMHFVTKKLDEMGFPPNKIVFSLERLMKCGMGFCGHCMVSGKFVCKDGPVFNYSEVQSFLEVAV